MLLVFALGVVLPSLVSAQLTDSYPVLSFPQPTTTAPSAACSSVLSTCPFAQPECVSSWCESGCQSSSNCCSAANPQLCLIEANLQDPCINMENSIVVCPGVLVPQCMCYDAAGNYAPTAFDNMAQSCYDIATTEQTDLLQYLTGTRGTLGFCTREAGPQNNSTTATAHTSTTNALTPSTTSNSIITGTGSTTAVTSLTITTGSKVSSGLSITPAKTTTSSSISTLQMGFGRLTTAATALLVSFVAYA